MNIDIGNRFQNSVGQWFTVQKQIPRGYSCGKFNESKYLIKFDSGYEKLVNTSDIKRKRIKDKLSPSLFGVGFLGTAKVDKVIWRIWATMLCRCYWKKGSYHKRGVRVCKRWHNFSNFQKDVINLEGFDSDNLKRKDGSGLELDKDIKGNGKLYSPKNCCFVTMQDNLKYKRNSISKRKYSVGYRFKNKRSFHFEVIEYKDNRNITVKCKETGIIKTVQGNQILHKQIKEV